MLFFVVAQKVAQSFLTRTFGLFRVTVLPYFHMKYDCLIQKHSLSKQCTAETLGHGHLWTSSCPVSLMSPCICFFIHPSLTEINPFIYKWTQW